MIKRIVIEFFTLYLFRPFVGLHRKPGSTSLASAQDPDRNSDLMLRCRRASCSALKAQSYIIKKLLERTSVQ
ncbi:MAG: hypothetical protein JW969_03295, partial [Spirochaetales bacterium]|nr:hypothetical protein [Spirochaetales bacterium]